MLQASIGEKGKTTSPNDYRGYTPAELDGVLDRLVALPPLSSTANGIWGDHAWLSVFDRGYMAHFYFGEEARGGRIGFELYGPYTPNSDNLDGDIRPGAELSGMLPIAAVREVLRLLDSGSCPIEFVRTASAVAGE